MKQATAAAITITHGPSPENFHIWVVKRGDTFLATISFDGPRGTMVTHQGELYADERKEVYRLYELVRGR
jgi:hypothetical protein